VGGGLKTYKSFGALERADMRRMGMLALSRDSNLVFGHQIFSNPRNIINTVIPSLVVAPPMLLAAAAFATGAVLARYGVLDDWAAPSAAASMPGTNGNNGTAAATSTEHAFMRDYDNSALTGASVLISFLISFYLGYCYNRYYTIYSQCMSCRNHVMECCALARLYLYDSERVWAIWRYVNLAHVAAMVGLSPVYTVENLFSGFVREQGLFEFDDDGNVPQGPNGHAHELQMLRACLVA